MASYNAALSSTVTKQSGNAPWLSFNFDDTKNELFSCLFQLMLNLNSMALNSLLCADVPLRNCSTINLNSLTLSTRSPIRL